MWVKMEDLGDYRCWSNGEMMRKSQGIEGHRCLDALPEHRSQRGFQDQPGGRLNKWRLATVNRDEGVMR